MREVCLHVVRLRVVFIVVVAVNVVNDQELVWVRLNGQPSLALAHRFVSVYSRVAKQRYTVIRQFAARESLRHAYERLLQTGLGRPIQLEHCAEAVVVLARKLNRQLRLTDTAKAVDDDHLLATLCCGRG
jgi:hypothetical protein